MCDKVDWGMREGCHGEIGYSKRKTSRGQEGREVVKSIADSEGKKKSGTKTYNTEDSQVVTDPSTNSALSSLSMGERTGSRVFWKLWSYVTEDNDTASYIGVLGTVRNLQRKASGAEQQETEKEALLVCVS